MRKVEEESNEVILFFNIVIKFVEFLKYVRILYLWYVYYFGIFNVGLYSNYCIKFGS